jgi:hypothetical protein
MLAYFLNLCVEFSPKWILHFSRSTGVTFPAGKNKDTVFFAPYLNLSGLVLKKSLSNLSTFKSTGISETSCSTRFPHAIKTRQRLLLIGIFFHN